MAELIYPDFVAVDDQGTHWLIETKGMESTEVAHKDLAASNWCENATELTGTQWRYLKIPQKAFEVLQPSKLEHLQALVPATLITTSNETRLVPDHPACPNCTKSWQLLTESGKIRMRLI